MRGRNVPPDAGLYGLVVRKEFGGWGSGFLGYAIAAEELAQGSPTTTPSYNMHGVALLILLTKSVLSTERRQGSTSSCHREIGGSITVDEVARQVACELNAALRFEAPLSAHAEP